MLETLNRNSFDNLQVTYQGNKYEPFLHKQVIDNVYESLDKLNLSIVKEKYISNKNLQKLIGIYTIDIDCGNFKPKISFKNSLDGSMRFGIVAGTIVNICSNGNMFGDDFEFFRKHIGNSNNDIYVNISTALDKLKYLQERHFNLEEKLSNKFLNFTEKSNLLGRLFLEQDILTSNQLNVVKREILNPLFEYTNKNSEWDFYNYCTFALRDSNPKDYHKKHKLLYNYFNN